MKHRLIAILASALALAALTECGPNDRRDKRSPGEETVENATLAKLNLRSDAFENGQPIPQQYSCDGTNHSPGLSWDEAPQGTKSFALLIDDPDAPTGTFRHWGVYDIPAATRAIGEGQRVGSELKNDKGTSGYTGPCPPPGHGVHHYHFKLFALGVDRLNVGPDITIAQLEEAVSRQALGEGELIGTYERK